VNEGFIYPVYLGVYGSASEDQHGRRQQRRKDVAKRVNIYKSGDQKMIILLISK
jgi:hypothetical protein